MVPAVMSAIMTLLLSPIFLLWTSGVFGQDWNVIYETKSMCVLKGSSVNMSCTYTYPREHNLTDTFWINKLDVEKSLKDYPEYKDRVEYIEDRQNKTAVLRLNNVTENDEKEYCFRFITDKDKWFGQPGIQLNVSGLQVQAPQLVLEKETLNLTCRTTCNLTDRFIWYKNGQALKFTSDILQLQSVRSDSGRYSCAVRGHEHLPSPAVSIGVQYPPHNTSVWVSGSGVIVEGDSVTLNCISDSNPPAEINWIKGGTILESGDTYSITNIKSEASGNYYCSARNKHGSQTSAAVNVNVMYPPESVSVWVSGSGVIVEGDSVTLNCISDSNPPAEINWIKGGTILESGDTYSITNIKSEASGNYYCSARNKHGSQTSADVNVNVMYPPESVSVWVSGSGVIVEGDSVTLNCSSDSNPPALNFSWFKGGTFVGSGRIFSISNISSDHSGEYKCKSINKHGEKDSDAEMLNVMYRPRNVSVWVSGSGVIVEGDSVTLNCSSDSNPPALNFSWFKENETSAVGSGQSFSISSFNSSFSGRFYCEAQNKHGSRRSASVSLTVKVVGRLVILYKSIGVICGAAVIIIMLLLIWRSRGMNKRTNTMESQMNRSSPRHDRRKACDVEFSEPVYENVMVNVPLS